MRPQMDRSWRLVTPMVLSLFLACDGQDLYAPRVVSADDSAAPLELRAAYRDDAARLALREILATDDPALRQVALPDELVQRYYEALIRVFNLSHPARDAVVERYSIHTFPSPSVHRVSLGVVADWAATWARGEVLTGDPEVDALVSAYDLRVVSHYHSTSLGHLFTLESPMRLNTYALARVFGEILGVSWASEGSASGDGADITAELDGSGLVLEYRVGWGDCPSGCINRHFWSFDVQLDGTVRFLGGRGDPVPPPDQVY